MKREKDFEVGKFYFYYGPSHLLNTRSLVFRIHLDTQGPEVDFYNATVYTEFPSIAHYNDASVIDLFVHTLREVLRLGRDLFIKDYSVREEGEQYQVAIEYLDENTAEDAVHLVSDWFKSMNEGTEKKFNFNKKLQSLYKGFELSLASDPLLYAMMEASIARDVPYFFLPEETQLQWGYGRKQLRSSDGIFHTDSVVDREYTMFYGNYEFLHMGGFPIPTTTLCFSEEGVLEKAQKMRYPLVLKPLASGMRSYTAIEGKNELRRIFRKIQNDHSRSSLPFTGILLQEHLPGNEYCLITIGGRYVTAFSEQGQQADQMHQDNIVLIENLAAYFQIKNLGIRVIAPDLNHSWREGHFGIINLVASPEFCFGLEPPRKVFDSMAVMMLQSHFTRPENARIPIIVSNNFSQNMVSEICKMAHQMKPGIFTASLSNEGIFFNGHFFFNNPGHEQNVRLILRHPQVQLAVISHEREKIYESGFFHEGADVVILQDPNWAEEALEELLLPGAALAHVLPGEIKCYVNNILQTSIPYNDDASREGNVLQWIKTLLPELLIKYE